MTDTNTIQRRLNTYAMRALSKELEVYLHEKLNYELNDPRFIYGLGDAIFHFISRNISIERKQIHYYTGISNKHLYISCSIDGLDETIYASFKYSDEENETYRIGS